MKGQRKYIFCSGFDALSYGENHTKQIFLFEFTSLTQFYKLSFLMDHHIAAISNNPFVVIYI